MGPFVIANVQVAELSPLLDGCILPGEIQESVFLWRHLAFQGPKSGWYLK